MDHGHKNYYSFLDTCIINIRDYEEIMEKLFTIYVGIEK